MYEKLNLQEGDILTAEYIEHIENEIKNARVPKKILDGSTLTVELGAPEGSRQFAIIQFENHSDLETFMGCTIDKLIDFLRNGGEVWLQNVSFGGFVFTFALNCVAIFQQFQHEDFGTIIQGSKSHLLIEAQRCVIQYEIFDLYPLLATA